MDLEASSEDAYEYFRNNFRFWADGRPFDKDAFAHGDAVTLGVEGVGQEDGEGVAVLFKEIPSASVMAHEAVHCANIIQMEIGEDIMHCDTDENFAYLVGFIVNEMEKFFEGGK